MVLGLSPMSNNEFMAGEKEDLIADLWDRLSNEEKLFHMLHNLSLWISESKTAEPELIEEAREIQKILDDHMHDVKAT
jgi:hypothetical protein